MLSAEKLPDLEAIMKEIRELLNLYLENKAKRTQTIYRHTFTHWEEFIQGRHRFFPTKAILAPSKKDLALYVQTLRQNKTNQGRLITEASVQARIKNLKTIYNWLIDAGHIEAPNPISLPFGKPKDEARRPTRIVNWEKDVRRLISCWGSDYEGKLNEALITILFGCALRRSEAVQLLSVDLELHLEPHVTIRCHQKNSQNSDLPIPRFALPGLRKFESVRVTTGDPNFFVKENGKRISDSYVRWTFKEALKRVGLPTDKYSCHSARATAITHLLDLGLHHREVKAFSRHASVGMVERYDKRRYTVKENAGNKLDLD